MNAADTATQLARTLLANDLRCAVDDIQVVDVEAVEWNDSALGCPQPGMMYMQMITPGYRITLEHAAQRYHVHTDAGRRAVRCDRARPSKRKPAM
jgi:hypothetical protein